VCDADALCTALAVAGRLGLPDAVLRDYGTRQITAVKGDGSLRRLL
jgi:hypothetical protein